MHRHKPQRREHAVLGMPRKVVKIHGNGRGQHNGSLLQREGAFQGHQPVWQLQLPSATMDFVLLLLVRWFQPGCCFSCIYFQCTRCGVAKSYGIHAFVGEHFQSQPLEVPPNHCQWISSFIFHHEVPGEPGRTHVRKRRSVHEEVVLALPRMPLRHGFSEFATGRVRDAHVASQGSRRPVHLQRRRSMCVCGFGLEPSTCFQQLPSDVGSCFFHEPSDVRAVCGVQQLELSLGFESHRHVGPLHGA
mmetsp:Transcript_4822/g.30629  ORF Transcript_4822/g.30629 Transcript_4822/m.30629 type:complete len:246 (+) Transcript_4822:781-1518(+)